MASGDVTLRYGTVSFLSDYGLGDEFVGVVRSVVMGHAPGVEVVDITHGIPAHDVRAGSLALARSAPYLCPGVVLAVVDRNLRSVGRTARDAIHSDMAPLEAIRHYLEAANVAVADTTEAFARDLATLPAGQRLSDQHSDYLVAVTRRLLDLAVERGDIDDVDTAAVARVTASLGRDLSRPDVFTTLRSTPKEAADAVLDLVLSGLTAHRA
jgi:hypothetical protein